jgi:hypothetical protein
VEESLAACLVRAKLIWASFAASGPIYCLVTFLVARQSEEGVLDWPGFMYAELPVSEWVVLAGFVLLTPVYMANVRALMKALRIGHAPASGEGDSDAAAVDKWLRAQVMRGMFSELPLVLALALAIAFGMLLTLWATTAVHLAMMILHAPRRSDLEEGLSA